MFWNRKLKKRIEELENNFQNWKQRVEIDAKNTWNEQHALEWWLCKKHTYKESTLLRRDPYQYELNEKKLKKNGYRLLDASANYQIWGIERDEGAKDNKE